MCSFVMVWRKWKRLRRGKVSNWQRGEGQRQRQDCQTWTQTLLKKCNQTGCDDETNLCDLNTSIFSFFLHLYCTVFAQWLCLCDLLQGYLTTQDPISPPMRNVCIQILVVILYYLLWKRNTNCLGNNTRSIWTDCLFIHMKPSSDGIFSPDYLPVSEYTHVPAKSLWVCGWCKAHE